MFSGWFTIRDNVSIAIWPHTLLFHNHREGGRMLLHFIAAQSLVVDNREEISYMVVPSKPVSVDRSNINHIGSKLTTTVILKITIFFF